MADSNIVTVLSVTGEVYVQTPEGNVLLQVGDTLDIGQVITTGPGSSIELLTADGETIVITPMTMFAVTDDLLIDTAAGPDESAVASDSEQQVLDALASGRDILENLEAPAAGGGEGGVDDPEGSSFIILERIEEDYRNSDAEVETLQSEELVLEEGSQEINLPPDAVDDAVSTPEDTPVVISVLSNDTDPENEPLSVIDIPVAPSNGSVVVNNDGTVTYTPNANFNGEDSFEYTITDPTGQQDTATVTISVSPVNDDPVITETSPIAVSEEGLAGGIADSVGSDDTTNSATDSGSVTATDLEGDTLTYTLSNPPAGLTSGGTDITWTGAGTGTLTGSAGGETILVVSIDGNGDWTADLQGPIDHADTSVEDDVDLEFTVTVDDGNGGSDSATITVTVEDDSPDAGDNSYQVDENSDLIVNVPGVLGNDDSGADGGLAIVGNTDPSNGSVTLNADGSFTYTPDTDYDGPDSFTYTVEDADGDQSTATVNITVVANLAPEITATTGATVSEEGLDGGIADTDGVDDTTDSTTDSGSVTASDPEGDTLTYTLSNAPSGLTSNGTPVIWEGAGTDTLTGSASGEPVLIVSIDGNGDWTADLQGPLDHADSTVEDDVDLDFTVTVEDGSGGSDSATITVTVEDDSPDAVNNNYNVNEDGELIVNAPGVLGNDLAGADGGLTIVGNTDVSNGSLTLNADGSFTYTPDADFNGSDSFTYTVEDADGDQDTATVNITVNSVNDLPTAIDDLNVIAEETDSVDGNVLTGQGDPDSVADSDPEGDDLDVTGFVTGNQDDGDLENPDTDGSITGTYGTLTWNVETGAYTYDLDNSNPAVQGLGIGDSLQEVFTYEMNDGNGGFDTATLTISINGENDGPVIDSVTDTTVSEEGLDGAIADDVGSDDTTNNAIDSGTVSASDVDGDALSYYLSNPPAGLESGGVAITWSGNGTGVDGLTNATELTGTAGVTPILVVSIDGNGDWTADLQGPLDHPTPNVEDDIDLDFTVTVDDGNATATETITVAVEDDSPDADDDGTYFIDEETDLIVNVPGVLANDEAGADGDLTIVGNTDPSNGSVTLNADGSFTYSPNPQYNGPDSFTYTVEDADGDQSTATVNIEVLVVSDPPTLEEANDTFVSEEGFTGALPDNVGVNDTTDSRTDSDTFTIKDVDGTDGLGAAYTVDDFTLATDAALTTADGESITFAWDAGENALIGTRDDNNAEVIRVSVDSVTQSSDEYEVGYSVELADGEPLLHADDTIEDDLSFGIDVTAGITTFADAFSVTVEDDSPEANDNNYNVDEDGELNVAAPGILGNDDAGGDGGLTIIDNTNPDHGELTLNADGSFVYTPDDDYFGPDSFDYTVRDADGDESEATVFITVNSVNDAPLAIDDFNQIGEDTDEVSGNDLTGAGDPNSTPDSDPEGDDLDITGFVTGDQDDGDLETPDTDGSITGTYGTLTWNDETGAYTYDLDNNNVAVQALKTGQSLEEVFTYEMNDGNGGFDTATLTITINGADDANPTISVQDNSVTEGTSEMVTGSITVGSGVALTSVTVGGEEIIGHDFQGGSNPINVGGGAHGSLQITGFDGSVVSYKYTEDGDAEQHNPTNDNIVDSYAVSVTDAEGDSENDTLDITTLDTVPDAIADNPGAVSENAVNVTGNVVTGTNASADTIGADATTVTGVSADDATNVERSGNVNSGVVGDYGTLTIDASGGYTYVLDQSKTQPLKSGSVTDTFTYTIKDSDGDWDTTTVTFTINAEDDAAPTISVQDNSVTEATSDMVTGTITVGSGVALTSVTVGGEEIIGHDFQGGANPINVGGGAYGSLQITGFDGSVIDYKYTEDGDAESHNLANDNIVDSYAVSVTDAEGDSENDTLDITTLDTVPDALADARTVNEDQVGITGEVVLGDLNGSVADLIGADATSVTGVSADDATNVERVGNVGGAGVAGTYGTLTIDSTGSYSYVLNAAAQLLNDGDQVTDTFTYTIKDADGDWDTTTVTFTIDGVSEGSPTVSAPGNTIAEDAVTTVGGSFTVTAPDGLQYITVDGQQVTEAQLLAATPGTPVTITPTSDESGTLNITGYTPGTGVVTYTYAVEGVAKSHNAANDNIVDTITITVTDDANVTSAPDDLDILITDTVPTANPDSGSVTEDAVTNTVTGNVITGTGSATADTESMDTPTNVVGVAVGNTGTTLESPATVGAVIVGTYGSITIAADGSYTYTLNNADPDTNALQAGQMVSDVFTYTIEDDDGDLDFTTVTIAITGANDGPVAVNDLNQISEETDTVGGNVLTGAGDPNTTPDSDPDGDDLDVVGFVTGDADDGDLETPDTDGTIVGTYGTLTWTAETGAYTYDLDNANPTVQGLGVGQSLQEIFTYEISDGNGGIDTATLTITINGENDGPVIESVTDIAVSEEGLSGGIPDDVGTDDTTNLTTDSGTVTATDVDGDTLSYYLSNPPGGLTSDGVAVTWAGNGSGINGLTEATQLTGSAGGNTILVVSIDGSGNWTANLQGPLDHADDSIEDDMDLDFTVTVDDGTTAANDTITVTVEDDSPALGLVNDGPDGDSNVSLSVGNPATDTTYTGQFLDWEVGADGFDSVSLTTADNVVISSQTESQIVLSLEDGSAILTLNADGTDSLHVLYREPDISFHPEGDFTASASGPTGQYFLDNTNLRMIISGDDGDAVAEPTSDDAVNTSTQGWAVKGQQGQTMQDDETLTFMFEDAPGGAGSPTDVDDFRFSTTGYTGGISSAMITVTVYTSSDLSTSLTRTWTVSEDEVIQISEDIPGFTLATQIWQIDITSEETGGSFRVNGIEVGTTVTTFPDDLDFFFTLVAVSDKDGDSVSQAFNVHLDGEPSADGLVLETILGTSAADTISSTDADDTMTGGLGADTFEWNLNDQGTAGSPATDTVTDFNQGGGVYSNAEGDSLNLQDLLPGLVAQNDLDDYLHVEATNGGADTTIYISTGGAYGGSRMGDGSQDDQVIVLEGVDLNDMLSGGEVSQQDVIDSLILNNHLVAD